MQTTTNTPQAALSKIAEAVGHVEGAIALLRDAETIIGEQTNGSTNSGLPDVRAAIFNLGGGDDPEMDPILGHLRAVLTANRSASQVWSAPHAPTRRTRVRSRHTKVEADVIDLTVEAMILDFGSHTAVVPAAEYGGFETVERRA